MFLGNHITLSPEWAKAWDVTRRTTTMLLSLLMPKASLTKNSETYPKPAPSLAFSYQARKNQSSQACPFESLPCTESRALVSSFALGPQIHSPLGVPTIFQAQGRNGESLLCWRRAKPRTWCVIFRINVHVLLIGRFLFQMVKSSGALAEKSNRSSLGNWK